MELTVALAGEVVLSGAVSQRGRRRSKKNKNTDMNLIENMGFLVVRVVRVTSWSHVNHGIARLN
jgi:hypothetical protein